MSRSSIRTTIQLFSRSAPGERPQARVNPLDQRTVRRPMSHENSQGYTEIARSSCTSIRPGRHDGLERHPRPAPAARVLPPRPRPAARDCPARAAGDASIGTAVAAFVLSRVLPAATPEQPADRAGAACSTRRSSPTCLWVSRWSTPAPSVFVHVNQVFVDLATGLGGLPRSRSDLTQILLSYKVGIATREALGARAALRRPLPGGRASARRLPTARARYLTTNLLRLQDSLAAHAGRPLPGGGHHQRRRSCARNSSAPAPPRTSSSRSFPTNSATPSRPC